MKGKADEGTICHNYRTDPSDNYRTDPSDVELIDSLNEVSYIATGSWRIKDCEHVVITPTKHRILDDTVWKSRLFGGPTPQHETYNWPDDAGLVLSALGRPLGLFQQFDSLIEWDSTEITFQRIGSKPLAPLTRDWPWDQ